MTSAYVSAGKSLIISNVAVSFAQMNKKVLLIDGDLRCPVLHKIFNLDNKVQGMSDVLAGLCSYEDLYRRNGGYENLNIITSGKIPPNPAELLASDNMKAFMDTVKEEYDVILIDLPPVCEVSDAGIIYDLVTGYTFVVRSGYSDRRMINLAVETMEGFGANLSGFILNDIDIKSGDYYKNKYYSSYSKYRFRYGKSGYYRHFKYGYYKGYTSRYGYSRYSRYSRYGNTYGNTAYGNNYARSQEQVNAEEENEQLREELEIITVDPNTVETFDKTATKQDGRESDAPAKEPKTSSGADDARSFRTSDSDTDSND
jgi:capsular exopolysaccharide synthesis family protein